MPMTATVISVVIPVLNEAEALPGLIAETKTVLDVMGVAGEIIVVDDGSIDGSAAVAHELGCRVLRSERNQGKAAGLQAGFDTAAGEIIITMDGDGQDDPAEIPRLVAGLDSADLVNGWKRVRRDSTSRRTQSRMYGWMVRVFTGVRLRDFNSGLKAYRSSVVRSIRLYGDLHRLTPVLAADAGFRVAEIPVNHRPRRHGRSRYGWGRALRGPLDVITVLFLGRFAQRPLHLFGTTGLVMGFSGFTIALYLTWLKVVNGEAIGDRPLLLLSVLLMLAGLQLFSLGLIGEMVRAGRRQTPPFHEWSPPQSSSRQAFPPQSARPLSASHDAATPSD